MKTSQEIILVSLFGALYLGGVVGLGLGLPMVVWYPKQNDVIGPSTILAGLILGMCAALLVSVSMLVRGVVDLARRRPERHEPLVMRKSFVYSGWNTML
jgi:hypothetical protein